MTNDNNITHLLPNEVIAQLKNRELYIVNRDKKLHIVNWNSNVYYSNISVMNVYTKHEHEYSITNDYASWLVNKFGEHSRYDILHADVLKDSRKSHITVTGN